MLSILMINLVFSVQLKSQKDLDCFVYLVVLTEFLIWFLCVNTNLAEGQHEQFSFYEIFAFSHEATVVLGYEKRAQ